MPANSPFRPLDEEEYVPPSLVRPDDPDALGAASPTGPNTRRLEATDIAQSQLPARTATPDSAVLERLAQVPEQADNSPVQLPDAETVAYSTEPERDWRKEFEAARGAADQDRAGNEFMRSIAGIGTALSGVKRDDAFFDRMDARAGRGEAALQKEYELDILANKNRQSKAEKDPASAQNRAAQDFFAANFGYLIPKGRGDIIRGMTGKQLLDLSGQNTKMQLALAEIAAKGANTALTAQKELRRGAEASDKQGVAEYNAVSQRAKELDPVIPAGAPGSGMVRPADVSSAQNKLAKYTDDTKGIRGIADLLGALDATNPGLFQANPKDIEKMSLDPNWVSRARGVAPGVIALFDKNADETAKKEAQGNIQRTIEGIRQHEAYGANLTVPEMRRFEELTGRQWLGHPGASIMALQIYRNALRREARKQDLDLRNSTEAAPQVYARHRDSGGLLTQMPIFRGGETGQGAIGGAPSETTGNKTDVNPSGPPPPTNTGTRKIVMLDEKGNVVGKPVTYPADKAALFLQQKHKNGAPGFKEM